MNCLFVRNKLLMCAVLVAGSLFAACTHNNDSSSEPSNAAVADHGNSTATHVPVHVAAVSRESVAVIIAAPGHTDALRQERIRAPFASRLIALNVADGDHVSKGEKVAIVLSKNSAAALAGAEQMLASAHSDADKADAQRAVQLARSHLVQQTLNAPSDGVVLSHAAETGDYVDEGEILVTLADASSVYFNAQVSQGDVDRVRAGQTAHIDVPALSAQAIDATVHGHLPVASSQDFSAPVRLDFSAKHPVMQVGLFGIAHIIVAQHANATVIPASAILRDDVNGVSRIAIIDAGVAHWLTVETGTQQGDRVEILQPAIDTGTSVIVDGQVGLPEGARAVVQQ